MAFTRGKAKVSLRTTPRFAEYEEFWSRSDAMRDWYGPLLDDNSDTEMEAQEAVQRLFELAKQV